MGEKLDKVSKNSIGEEAPGRLYTTAMRAVELPFLISAMMYSGVLSNLGSDLVSILTFHASRI